LLYGTLAVIEIRLIVRTVQRGPFAEHDPDPLPHAIPATPMVA
jgi:cytochrome d ubiquinol oxidase subunit I